MKQDRRTFLKTTSLVAAAAAGLPAATTAQAQTTAPTSRPTELPKGVTFATLRTPDGLVLGLRTDRGVLNVAAAERDFREGAPTTIDAVFKGDGDISGLNRLVAKARASATPDRYFISSRLTRRRSGPASPIRRRSSASVSTTASTPPRPAMPCRSCRSFSTNSTPR